MLIPISKPPTILVDGDGDVVGPASSTDSDIARFDGTDGKLLKSGLSLDTDVNLAADSDSKVASQKATKAFVLANAGGSVTDNSVGIRGGSDFNINDTTETLLTFDTEDWDVGGLHDAGGDTSRITIVTNGRYLVTFQGYFSPGDGIIATGCYSALRKNGANQWYEGRGPGANGFPASSPSFSIIMKLVATDYIQVAAYQNSGGAVHLAGGFMFQCHLLAED